MIHEKVELLSTYDARTRHPSLISPPAFDCTVVVNRSKPSDADHEVVEALMCGSKV